MTVANRNDRGATSLIVRATRDWQRALVGALLISLCAIGGCADVSFKRGASAQSISNDERSCRNKTNDDGSYRSCMRDRGLYVASFRSNDGENNLARENESAPLDGTAARLERSATTGDEPEFPGNAAATFGQPSAAQAVTAMIQAPTGSSVPVPREHAPLVPGKDQRTNDPLTERTVASWWKLGGTASGLDTAVADCAAQLGAPHVPKTGAQRVTEGMHRCLRKQGWYALGE